MSPGTSLSGFSQFMSSPGLSDFRARCAAARRMAFPTCYGMDTRSFGILVLGHIDFATAAHLFRY